MTKPDGTPEAASSPVTTGRQKCFDGKSEGLTRDDILDNVTLYWLTNAALFVRPKGKGVFRHERRTIHPILSRSPRAHGPRRLLGSRPVVELRNEIPKRRQAPGGSES